MDSRLLLVIVLLFYSQKSRPSYIVSLFWIDTVSDNVQDFQLDGQWSRDQIEIPRDEKS